MAQSNKAKLWEQRVDISERKFKKLIKTKIQLWREYYRGNQWNPLFDENQNIDIYKDQVVDNMVFSNIRTIMPSINFRNPKIFTKPLKKPHRVEGGVFDTISASVLLEITLNYYFRELEIKRQVDKCLLDALLGPWGVIQLGYTAEIEKIETKGEGVEEIEINEVIKSDMPFAVRRSPMDFRVDASAKDSHLEDAEWIAFRWIKRLEDVKKNPRYNNTAKLKSNFVVKTDFGDAGAESNESVPDMAKKGNEDFMRVEGWDIWNKRNRRLITLVKGHDRLLQDTDWPIEFDGFPVEILYFNENPDEIFPVADTDIYLAAQDELNRIRSLQLTHIRNVSSRKYIGRENAFMDNELDKITMGGDGAIAMTSSNPVDSLVPLKDANVSQDLYIAINQLKQSIPEILGLPLGSSRKFDTATEPALLAQSASTRVAERTGILEDFYKRISRKVAQILQQTLDGRTVSLSEEEFSDAQQFASDKLEKIVGEGNTVLLPWLKVDKEDIKGEYEFTVEVGSTRPFNQEVRKRDIQELTQLIGSSQALAQLVEPLESLRRILDAYEITDPERLLKDPQEVQQQAQQAQQQAVQAEQAKDQPKRDTDLEKTKIKSQTTLTTALIKASSEAQKQNKESEEKG